MDETHNEVVKFKHLPRVGQIVRSKAHGSLWRVISKKEVWQSTSDDPETGEPRLLPAIHLTYWKIQKGVPPGVGKMLGYVYTMHDNTFGTNWQIESK